MSVETRHIDTKVRLEAWLHNTMVAHQELRTDNKHYSVLTLFDLFEAFAYINTSQNMSKNGYR